MRRFEVRLKVEVREGVADDASPSVHGGAFHDYDLVVGVRMDDDATPADAVRALAQRFEALLEAVLQSMDKRATFQDGVVPEGAK
jgi:hypothetical protein